MRLSLVGVAILPVAVLGLLGAAFGQPFAVISLADPSTPYVAIVDTATDTVSTFLNICDGFPICHSGGTYGVAVTPDGTRAYLTSPSRNAVLVVDFPGGGFEYVPVGVEPRGIAINPDGTRVYVANVAENTVSVIDTSSNTVIAAVPVGQGPTGLAVHPDGSRVYVTCFTAGMLSVIDSVSNAVEATVPGLSGPRGVAVHPDGTRVYVGLVGSRRIAVIDATTNTIRTR